MTEIPESVMESAREIAGEIISDFVQIDSRSDYPGVDFDAEGAEELIARALLAAEKRGEERERERCAGIAHKQVFTAKQWGGKDEMLEGGNRRARVIAYLIRKEPAE